MMSMLSNMAILFSFMFRQFCLLIGQCTTFVQTETYLKLLDGLCYHCHYEHIRILTEFISNHSCAEDCIHAMLAE